MGGVPTVLHNLLARPGTPATIAQEMVRAFTEDLLCAAETRMPEKTRRRRVLEWNMTTAARATLGDALDKQQEARHAFKADPNPATWRILKATCKGVKAAIATGIYDHLERFVSELEAIYQSRSQPETNLGAIIHQGRERRAVPEEVCHLQAVAEIVQHPSELQVPHPEIRRRRASDTVTNDTRHPTPGNGARP